MKVINFRIYKIEVERNQKISKNNIAYDSIKSMALEILKIQLLNNNNVLYLFICNVIF